MVNFCVRVERVFKSEDDSMHHEFVERPFEKRRVNNPAPESDYGEYCELHIISYGHDLSFAKDQSIFIIAKSRPHFVRPAFCEFIKLSVR
jgi:hypothetical protein